MKTYAIVKWNPGFDRSLFAQCKAQGVVQTSFDTVRKSLDGNRAILSWVGTTAKLPAAIGANLIATYDHDTILALINSDANWTSPNIKASPQPLLAEMLSTEVAPQTATFWQRNKWKIAAGTAAAAAASAALWHYLG